MLLSRDDERRELFTTIVSGLRRRGLYRQGYRYTQPRDPRRNPDEIKRQLGVAYVERRRHELGTDISAVVSLRRWANVVKLRRPA